MQISKIAFSLLLFFIAEICDAESLSKLSVSNAESYDYYAIDDTYNNTSIRTALQEEIFATEAMRNGNFSIAHEHLNRALVLYENNTDDSLHIAFLYSMVASCKEEINADSEEIIRYYSLASSIYKNAGSGIKAVECMLENRRILYQLGRPLEYADITREIDQIISSLPSSSKLYILLGNEQYKGQNHSAAIPYYEKAKSLFEEEGYENDYASYWTVCSNLMISYYKVQRFKDAIVFGNELISICEKNEKESSPLAFYEILLTQTQCYVRLGNPDGALECAEFAQKKLGDNPNAMYRNVAVSLMIDVYKQIGNYEKMLEYAMLSDSILATEFDETHFERLNVLIHRINALSYLGRHKEAVALSRHKRDIKKEHYSNNIDEYKKDLLGLANIEAFSGFYENPSDMDSAKIHMAEYAYLEESEIKKQAPWLTSAQRESLWSKAQRTLLQITGFAVQSGSIREPFIEDVYNAHLLASGLLLQTERAMNDAIKLRGTDEDIKSLNLLVALRDSLAITERNREIEKMADFQINIRNLENMLLNNCKEISDYEAYLNTNFKSIIPLIKQGTVLVDFLEVQHTQNNDKSVTAFIVRPEWKHPHLMRICRYSEIDKLTESLNSRLYEDGISQSFRHLVLDSVLQYIKPGETFYYVPNGVLHSVAPENLKTDDGKLLSEVYDMRRLSSAREISRLYASKTNDFRSAILYGALDYGSYPKQEKAEKVSTGYSSKNERGVGDAYEPLRATDYEIRTIESTLKKSRLETVLYRSTNGTEESFIALDGDSPDIIHLATHGYYLSQEQAKKVKGLSSYTDAMLLSGLVMSGGNAGWLNVPNEDGSMDGLLSAQDIAGLDLSKTKLVVLSACKTASGQNKADGIFGLQRAFKKAGAGTLILTLWGVNDQVTALFMTAFYHELAKNNWDRQKAFANAKKQIREQYPEPYFWAGFIMLD